MLTLGKFCTKDQRLCLPIQVPTSDHSSKKICVDFLGTEFYSVPSEKSLVLFVGSEIFFKE